MIPLKSGIVGWVELFAKPIIFPRGIDGFREGLNPSYQATKSRAAWRNPS
jgi:hypothetical protein